MDPSLNPSSHSASSTSPAVQDEFRSSDDYTSVSNAIDVALLSSTQSSMSSIPSFLSLTTCENSDNDAESLVIASSPTGSKPRQQQEQQPQAQLKQTCQDTPTQQQRPTSTLSTNTISSRSTLDRELTVRSKHTSTASTTSTLKHFSIIFTDVNESSSAASPTISSSPQNVANAPDSCSINSMQPKGTSAPSLYASDTHNPSVMPTSASQTPSFSYSYSTTDSPSNSNASVSSLNSITENVSILSYKRDNNKQHKKISKASISSPSELINHEDHFSSVPAINNRPPTSGTPATPAGQSELRTGFKKSHRSRNSVMASISQFMPFQRDQSETPFVTPTGKLSKQPSLQSLSSQASTSSSRLSRLADFKNAFRSGNSGSSGSSSGGKFFRSTSLSSRMSFFGVSSLRSSSHMGGRGGGNNGGNDVNPNDKPMISLPTPVDTSREKLKSKLRASTSLLSLTRLDRSINNTVMAVPIEQYNLSQMEKLLNFCEIPTVLDFQAYLDRAADGEDGDVFTKISVTSSSEVFAQGSKVYKIIPFGNEESDQSAIQDILQEIEISKTLQVLDGFIDVLEIVVVKGRYPHQLLPREYGTHIQPYAEDQKYCILVLNNGGKDLRRFRVESWADAESIFWQTAVALAQAEEHFQFEHRDLHWGNIVVDDRPDERVAPPQESDGTVTYSLADECGKQLLARSTLRITLIDYTLSRINAETSRRTATIHTRLDQPEFFRGKGDYQLDVYRFMRNNILSNGPIIDDGSAPNTPTSLRSTSYGTGVDWSVYTPKTNVYWLHYVAERLINHKGLRSANPTNTLRRNGASSSPGSAITPTSPLTPGTAEALESDLQAEEIQSCRALEAVYRALDPRKHRHNSNETTTTASVINDLGSARDVLRWGLKTKAFPGNGRA